MAQQIRGGSRKPRVVTDGGHRADDNKTTPEEKAEARRKEIEAQFKAEEIQLLSAISLGKKAMIAVDAAKAVLKEKQDAFSDIARNAKTAIKIPRAMFVELIEDSDAKDRVKVRDDEQKRARWRRMMGLPVGQSDEQLELEARLPDVERDGLHYQGIGYTDGVTGAPHNVPDGCAAAGHGNRYDAGYKDGQAALHAANQALKPKPRAAAAPKVDPNDDLSDPHSPASLRAAGEAEKRAKASLDAMGKNTEAAPAGGDTVAGAAGGDGFEATPEELAKQAGRGKTAEEIAADGGAGPDAEAVG